ncbi:MAG: Slp family lipoprotein [Candidatus Methylomirabilales bacterium]
MPRIWFIGLILALLTGCASVLPPELREQVDRQVSFEELQRDPASYRGRMVVLGGEILGQYIYEDHVELEILERPLSEGRDNPKLRALSRGRFRISHREPLEPAVYRTGRPITVAGLVQGGQALPGQDVASPVIEPKYLYLWPDRPFPRFSHFPGHLFHHRRFCD